MAILLLLRPRMYPSDICYVPMVLRSIIMLMGRLTKLPFIQGHFLLMRLFHSIIKVHLYVIVHPIRLPLITSTPVTAATEDVTYSYSFTVDDEDAGDVLTLSAVTKPSWLNFSWTPGQKSAVLSGTPGNTDAGAFDVVLRVSDNHTEVDQPFSINVAAVNDVPVITGQNVLYVDEDHVFTLAKSDLLITDVDNSSSDLVLQVLEGSNYSFDGNTIAPVANYSGQLSVNVVVKDLVSQSLVYPVVITVNPVNDAPVITSNPVLTAQANVAYIYAITVADEDVGDVLTITAPSKPDWLTFTTNLNSAFLTGTPTNSNVGSYAIVIKVNDGHQDVMQGFAIHVSGPSGIEEIDNSIISLVYPNPANDKIYFNLANTGSVKIQIFDITGKMQKEITAENEAVFEISISDMLSGIYIYKAYQNGKVAIGKITKN